MASSIRLLQPYSHVSAIALSFICLLLLLSLFKQQGETGPVRPAAMYLPSLFILSLVAVFSNPYFIFSFIIPAVAAYAGLRLTGARPLRLVSELSLFALLALAGAAGIALHQEAAALGLNLSRLPSEHIGLDRLGGNIICYFESLALLLGTGLSGGGGGIIFGSVNLCLFTLTAACAILILKKERDPVRRFACLYFLIVPAVMSFSFLLKAMISPRYLLPLLYSWGFFLALTVSGHYFPGKRFRYLVLALFLLSAGHNIQTKLGYKGSQSRAGLTDYLISEGLSYGYSGFWDSNIITLLSGNRVKVRAVEFTGYSLGQFYWASKSDWYKPFKPRGTDLPDAA
jgi:hypothetical protein